MRENIAIGNARAYGYTPVSGYATFTASGTAVAQTLTEQFGIASITCTAAGRYTVVLQDTIPGFVAQVHVIDPSVTVVHQCQILTKSPTTRTFTFAHYVSTTLTPTYALDYGSGFEFAITFEGRSQG